jgi:formate dehydrogenase maturation protein FdhE
VSARYTGDSCPACRSHQVIPYAVVVGATEEDGYQCQVCEVMWPVMIYAGTDTSDPVGGTQGPAA